LNTPEFDELWGKKYPHITQSWTNNWNQLATFFKYLKSVQTLIYTTNPIESLNSSIKRRTKSKGSFPTIDLAFKMLYLATQRLKRNGIVMELEIGVKFILNFVYFSVKLWKNIQSN
jgi:transposase-like protein